MQKLARRGRSGGSRLGLASAAGLMAAIAALMAGAPAVAGPGSQVRVAFKGQPTRAPIAALRTNPAHSAVPSPSNNSSLNAVTCASASNCWAVGDFQKPSTAYVNEAFRWDGKKWSRASTPDPGGRAAKAESELFTATCVSASDCWAVGYYTNTAGATENQALHWGGRKWKQVKTPDPGRSSPGGVQNELYAVTCAAASDCWAVGYYTKSNGGLLNEALRWNGKQWSLVKTPNPAGMADGDFNEIEGVTCTSKSACWGVGRLENPVASENEALTWNGKNWRRVSTPQLPKDGNEPGSEDYLYTVACESASDCWSVGYAENGFSHPPQGQAFHWNGKKWSQVSTPEPSFLSYLGGVACTSSSRCWAVGEYSTKTEVDFNEALRWNGKKWTKVSTPNPGGTVTGDRNALYWDTCVTSSDCWAVGSVQNSAGDTLNQALHWNGKRWSSK